MTENNSNPEDTGQISVAELLARNGQKTTAASSGGRRRRGVKGGISVAELTGEIPVVRADPASDEAPVIADPAPKAAPKAGQSAVTGSTGFSEPELLSGSTTAAGDLLNQSHDQTEQRAAAQRPVSAATRRGPDEKPERSPRSTGFVPRPRTQRTDVSKETEVGRAPDQAESAGPESVKTESPKTASLEIEKQAVAASADPDDAVTTIAPAAMIAPAATIAPAAAPAPAAESDSDSEDKTADDATAVVEAGTDPEPEAEPEAEKSDGSRAGRKDAVKQWLALLGQGVIAVVVGALLFKGFERLWDMLPWVALILAVLVIVGLVAMVRILRRTDDMFSMVIAIVVGVFVTLGPLAFQLSTG